MATREEDQAAVEAIIQSVIQELRSDMTTALRGLSSKINLTEFAELIRNGRYIDAIDRILEANENRFSRGLERATRRAADSMARWLNDFVPVEISLPRVNIRARNAHLANNLELIREFSAEQRQVVSREVARLGFEQGQNPRVVARNIKQSIGLTLRQSSWIGNARAELSREGGPDPRYLQRLNRNRQFDALIRMHIREGRTMSQADVSRITSSYRANFIAYRAEVISRTEGLRSVNRGSLESLQEAVNTGAIQTYVRIWHTSADDRVRDQHTTMEGQEVSGPSAFTDGDGNRLQYPGDPAAPASTTIQCRCYTTTRVDFLEEAPALAA